MFPSTPPQIAQVITQVSRATFVNAMHAAFLVGAAVAPDGAILALVTRHANAAAEGHAAMRFAFRLIPTGQPAPDRT